MDYGEGIATTGFYVALNEDDEGDMVGFSPEAVLSPPGRATGEACRHPRRMAQTQKSPVFRLGFLLYLMPGSSLLTWGDPTLPSALRRFTSEFGMGSGGTTALVPPGKFCFVNTSCGRID